MTVDDVYGKTKYLVIIVYRGDTYVVAAVMLSYFFRAGSEVHSEVPKFIRKFRSSFGSSEAVRWEVPNELPNFRTNFGTSEQTSEPARQK